MADKSRNDGMTRRTPLHRRTLVAAAVATPLTFLGRKQAPAADMLAAARAEGQITWYISHYAADLAQQVANAFTAETGVRVNVIRTTAAVAYERLQQEYRVKAANCDMFSTTDVGHYVRLKQAGRLARVDPPNAASILPEFRSFDPDGTYIPTNYGLIGITYNSAKVPPGEVPRTWPGLIDSKWKGRIALGHPGFSAYAATWALQMQLLYGWEYLEKLAANDPLVGRSINDTVTMLNSGERMIAAGPIQTTLTSVYRGNPLQVTYPEDGSVMIVSPSAVPVNAPHPQAARLFLDFLLGPEHSRLVAESGGLPLRPDIPVKPGVKLPGEVKTIRPMDAQITEGVPKVQVRWRDIFGS